MEAGMSNQIAVILDESEFRMLANLIDAAVRAGGLRAAKDALTITAKMEVAYLKVHPEKAEASAP
jgi:hypothetical protein